MSMVIVYMPWENDQYVNPYSCKQTSYIKVIPILHDVRIRSQFKWGDPEQTNQKENKKKKHVYIKPRSPF